MHLLSRCSALGPGPGPGSLPRAPAFLIPQVQARKRETWPYALFAPHLVPCGTAWHYGAPEVLRSGMGAPLGGGGAYPDGPNRTLRGFFGVPTTPWRTQFSALEGLLRPEVLAPIGLSSAGVGVGVGVWAW
jgi:hypothetical protein